MNSDPRPSASILLVEDDTKARMLLADVLVHAGHRIVAAESGEHAIELLSAQVWSETYEMRFDIVVSDIRLGAVDGLKVLEVARQVANPPTVILITGYGSIETAITALRSGAFDYLLKPFNPTELLACVERAITQQLADQRQAEAIRTITSVVDQLRTVTNVTNERRPSLSNSQPERYVEVGALILDRYRHAATFHNQPLRLTPIEYALLLCLGELQGRVLGYADIVRRTHGYTVEDSEAQSMLKVHVHNLRQKIAPAYLVNVRGTGYMLAAPKEIEQ
jgi:two-component system, OmpR family, response regulator